MKIDNIEINERFDFDKASQNFDNHVHKSVFSYDKFHSYIVDLSKYFLDYNNKNKILDLGCSTCQLIKKIQDKYKSFDIDYYGVDKAQKMIDFAKNNVNANFINSDILDFILQDNNKYDIICSVLTLQFINLEKRKQIVSNIYKKLNNDGCFMLVEKVLESNSEYNNIFVREYHNFKEKNNFTPQEILDKDKSLAGIMRPLTLEQNINLLKKCGFKTYSIFLKDFNFVGIMCIKKEI